MKKLFVFFIVFPFFAFSMHHKTDPIIFYLDLNIINKDIDISEFLDDIVKTVQETEPGTQLYEYYISDNRNKVSLIEIYKSDADAVIHMKNFLSAPHSGPFLENFEIESFKVLGNSSNELKKILNDFTKDHRILIDGFKRK
tara:strand:- start:1308 stop:1730 length:423 start_codon:yes stop_codon:yes gene_type:complete